MSIRPAIIKKYKKKSFQVYHGGAWKLAYADFVTAMMAFFLLMWLLGFTQDDTRKGIAEYFDNPYQTSVLGGHSAAGQSNVGKSRESVSRPEDLGQAPTEAADLKNLAELKQKIQGMINARPALRDYKDQIKLEINQEGLRVLVIDTQNRPMFQNASAQATPQTRLILKELAPVLNELPNKISINGHTDGVPYPENPAGYTNWELSSDRANAARQALVKGGVDEGKIMRVIGLASSSPYNIRDSFDPMNRRISIVVMSHKSEVKILQDARLDAPEMSAAPSSSSP